MMGGTDSGVLVNSTWGLAPLNVVEAEIELFLFWSRMSRSSTGVEIG